MKSDGMMRNGGRGSRRRRGRKRMWEGPTTRKLLVIPTHVWRWVEERRKRDGIRSWSAAARRALVAWSGGKGRGTEAGKEQER